METNKDWKKTMKREHNRKITNILIIGDIVLLLLMIVVVKLTKEEEKITIEQYQLKGTYDWKDIILWTESKESFEKAYGDSLREIGYKMSFLKGKFDLFEETTGDWSIEKKEFKYIVPKDNKDEINEIAEKSRGKTLVVIGSLFYNGTEFDGNAYWCENKK